MEHRLNEIQAKISRAHRDLAAATAEMQDENLRLASLIYGLRIGDVVTNRRGQSYKVTRITFWNNVHNPGEPSWLYGELQKKDGSFSNFERVIYEFEPKKK